MPSLAVIDVKENFCAVAVFDEGWKSNNLLGASISHGSFLDRSSGTAQNVKEEIHKFADVIDAVILLVPRTLVHVTSLEIPAKNKATLKKIMGFEVARHFPIPSEQLVYDYFTTARTDDGFVVNLAGLKKTDFNAYYKTAIEAGISPDIVSYSSSAWLPPGAGETEPENRTAIEITMEGMEISIVEGHRILYSKFSRFKPKIDEKDFLEPGLSDTVAGGIIKTISEELNRIRLVSGIELLSDYLKNVYLSGGGRMLDTIKERITSQPDFSDSTVSALYENGSKTGMDHTAVTIGALDWDKKGLIFNFIPKGLRKPRHDVAKRRLKVLSAAAAFLLFFWAASAYAIHWKTLSGLKGELAEAKKGIVKIEKVELKLEKYESYFREFKQFRQRPSFNLRILDGLTNALPRNTYLRSLGVRRKTITISGISADAASLLTGLENSPYFKNVRIMGAIKTQESGDRFKIGMELE